MRRQGSSRDTQKNAPNVGPIWRRKVAVTIWTVRHTPDKCMSLADILQASVGIHFAGSA